VLISVSEALIPYADKPLKSVTRGQREARPTDLAVIFPAEGHHCPTTGCKLQAILLGDNRHACVNNLPRVVVS